jgi:hypothetical protein
MSARKEQKATLPYLDPYNIVNDLSGKGEGQPDMMHPEQLINRTTEFALSRTL